MTIPGAPKRCVTNTPYGKRVNKEFDVMWRESLHRLSWVLAATCAFKLVKLAEHELATAPAAALWPELARACRLDALSVACALCSGHFVGLSHRPRAERPWSYSLGLALSLAQLAIFALAGAREHKLPGFARNMPLGAGFFAFCVLSDWAMQSRHFPKKRGLKTA